MCLSSASQPRVQVSLTAIPVFPLQVDKSDFALFRNGLIDCRVHWLCAPIVL